MLTRRTDRTGGAGEVAAPRPHAGAFRSRVARLHIDLLRVTSAICPGPSPAC